MKAKLTIGIALFLMLTATSVTWSSSPGAALISAADSGLIDSLTGIDCVLWHTSEFILVVPDRIPGAKLLVSANKNKDLYLIRIPDKSDSIRYSKQGTLLPVTGEWYLLEQSAGAAQSGQLPEDAIFLGYPTVLQPAGKTASSSIIPVTWNSQIQAMVDQVSQVQMIADLTVLADFETRYSYTQQCRDAAAWIGQEFQSLGYTVTYQEHDRTMAPNVIAEKPGVSLPEEIVIVCGHFDSTSLQPMILAPGADDNGTGTAATLTAARVMAGKHFERTIRFIGFSGEEQGLRGSQAYAQYAQDQGENIVGVINLDMIGYMHVAPGDLEIIGNTASANLVDLFIDASETYTSLVTNRIINGGITASDHAPFWARGYPALLGIEDYPVRYPHYHTIEDTVDKITPEFMTESSRAAVATVAHLAEPMLDVVYVFSVDTDDSSGDGDGYLDPNETISIRVEIMNNSSLLSGQIQMNLICLTGSQYVTVVNNSVTLPEIQPGEQTNNFADPFILQIRPDVPEFTDLTCIVALDCDAPHSSGYFFHETITSYSFQESVILFDMETDPGWTASDQNWEWGIPEGSGGQDHGNPDPAAGFTGERVLGNNMSGDYPANITTTITSPILDLSEVRDTELHFERWLNVENSTYDQAGVWIINNDGTFKIWENPNEITDNGWQHVALNISEYADDRSDVRIMFSLQTDGGWEYSGWNIDDVRIAGLAPGDPLPTPTPGFPADTVGTMLIMPDTVLESGDVFDLAVQWWNTTASLHEDLPMLIILDISENYWFWPDWTSEVAWELRSLPAATVGDPENVLLFQWPEISGSATNLRFWSAFTNEELTQIFGNYDMMDWEYR